MSNSIDPATAKARLAASRADMIAAMGYELLPDAMGDERNSIRLGESGARLVAGGRTKRSAVGRWWHTHPLNDALQLGRPFLEDYAQRQPGKLIAYGAGVGALLWILKPWKLLSAATVATILLHNVDIFGAVSTAINKTRPNT